jgi:uncharacterized protein
MKEIRDPIHGFISLNDWEQAIIDTPAFQRLQRIGQLGFTNMVYPSAGHSRFEHSLGVMHVATRMYERIVECSRSYLQTELNYDDSGLERDKLIIRIAALLHDIGHSPFSHAGEELMPEKSGKNHYKYKHEDYSAAIIETEFKKVIEDHPKNENYHIKAKEITSFLRGSSEAGRTLLWRNLIDSQLDADRADYLLRDSYHIGVKYGQFDLDRFINCLCVVSGPETGEPIIAVDKGGIQVAESLIILRYMMFTQVYYHHTRRAYDILINDILKDLLNGGYFPPPKGEGIKDFLELDDWKLLGQISKLENKWMKKIKNRNHYRVIYETRNIPGLEEISKCESAFSKLSEERIDCRLDEPGKSWYKPGYEELLIKDNQNCIPLSELSSVVKGLKPFNKKRIYVPLEERENAMQVVGSLR